MSQIRKILVANRGEIALRAIRTIKEMGKIAVAVYSTADKDALYLQYADASICIGGEKSSDSYLNVPAIISAAEISGCDAIFPGYGCVSENQDFVEICGFHDLKFIGPSVDSMVLMSYKSKAKEVMKKAGVPVIEGSVGALKSVDEAKELANKIGYPVIVKASSGGGGRGMRVVEKEEDLDIAYLSAESEASVAFGDGTLYMEKFIKNPRHIEVQIIGDTHGNAIHIGERDCSLQRRHQKLIEESPAIILDEKTRKRLHKVAIQAIKNIGYENAGTFEFLLDCNKNFYFMEMNTRLQVEHCVSEMLSG
ncbi:MAG: ATP-grasp domain-containing protein, partial [Campylobacteraceae bacterium]|nr:ATP-grasp domain-containing protein [Campylobacteraceae bacterium]